MSLYDPETEAGESGEPEASLEPTGDSAAEDDLGDAGKTKGVAWIDPEPTP